MIRFFYCSLLSVLCFLAAGCATRGSMEGLSSDVTKLQGQIGILQKSQADLIIKLDELSGQIQTLTSRMEENNSNLSRFSQKLEDMEGGIRTEMRDLSAKISKIPAATAVSASEIYQAAYKDFVAGNYDLAILGFQTYLEQAPEGAHAGNARLWLGECHFAKGEYALARVEFERTIQDFPKHKPLTCRAKLKRGNCFAREKKIKEALSSYQEVMKGCAGMAEAKVAEENYRALSSTQTQTP